MTQVQINEPTVDDAIDLLGVLSFGGLDPNVRQSLAEAVQSTDNGRPNIGPVVEVAAGLFMNALANRGTRDEIRGFLFNLWRTTEDEQATDSERDDFGHLTGEKRKAKLKKWRKMKASDLKNLIRAFVKSEFFEDFLSMFREELTGATSSDGSTNSNGSTDLEAVK